MQPDRHSTLLPGFSVQCEACTPPLYGPRWTFLHCRGMPSGVYRNEVHDRTGGGGSGGYLVRTTPHPRASLAVHLILIKEGTNQTKVCRHTRKLLLFLLRETSRNFFISLHRDFGIQKNVRNSNSLCNYNQSVFRTSR